MVVGDNMEKNKKMNHIGMIILISLFFIFFIITSLFLERRENKDNEVENTVLPEINTNNYEYQKGVISSLYGNVRVLYDVVNNKFKVSQDDVINMGDIVYKKITNFDEIMNNYFTERGINKYIADMGNFFAYNEDGYYLAGNLVSYQTYYFRGDNTNIYILNANENEINGIIYEKWKSNNKNTLATIKVVKSDSKWLIDDITILSSE